MGRTRKAWSKVVEEAGVAVRLYERSGTLYREVRLGNGQKDRKSLKHADRALAADQARELCRELARLRLSGITTGPVSLGQLFAAYLAHRGPQLTPERRTFVSKATGLLLSYFGESYRVDDLSQHSVDDYVQARRAGRVRPDSAHAAERPGLATIRNEVQLLSTICNWGATFRTGGRRLLQTSPLQGLRLPQEPNPTRPRASRERYERLLLHADAVDAGGRLRLLLVLAHHTGRRVNAILQLRRSDLYLSPEEVRAGLAASGEDETLADLWGAAIRWRAENDKKGYESHSPLPAPVREEVLTYLRENPKVGEAWLFPAPGKADAPVLLRTAGRWLRECERLARLPHLHRGGWHAFRRQWATARKSLPAQDVAAAGGWRDLRSLQTAYQSADASTMAQVMDYGT